MMIIGSREWWFAHVFALRAKMTDEALELADEWVVIVARMETEEGYFENMKNDSEYWDWCKRNSEYQDKQRRVRRDKKVAA